jgi:uncharacterized protein (DUF1499 family)
MDLIHVHIIDMFLSHIIIKIQAIRKLDDTEFKNPYDAQFIRVKSASKGGGRE